MLFKRLHGGKYIMTKNNVLIVRMAESEFKLLDKKAKQLKTTKSEIVRTATQNYIHNVNLPNEKLLQILKELRNLAYEADGDLRDQLIYKLMEVDLHLY